VWCIAEVQAGWGARRRGAKGVRAQRGGGRERSGAERGGKLIARVRVCVAGESARLGGGGCAAAYSDPLCTLAETGKREEEGASTLLV
jgi:hypothetical protein